MLYGCKNTLICLCLARPFPVGPRSSGSVNVLIGGNYPVLLVIRLPGCLGSVCLSTGVIQWRDDVRQWSCMVVVCLVNKQFQCVCHVSLHLSRFDELAFTIKGLDPLLQMFFTWKIQNKMALPAERIVAQNLAADADQRAMRNQDRQGWRDLWKLSLVVSSLAG